MWSVLLYLTSYICSEVNMYTLLQSQVINCGIIGVLDGLIFMDLGVPLCTYQSPLPVNYKIQSLFYIYTSKSLKWHPKEHLKIW